MLVLTRKTGERLRIQLAGEAAWITVVESKDGRCRIGVDTPKCVAVDREEVAIAKDRCQELARSA